MEGQKRKPRSLWLQNPFSEIFGLNRGIAYATLLLLLGATTLAVFWFFHSAPPAEIVISSGTDGSMYRRTADRYKAILARSHVKVRVLPSEGSLQNLERLLDGNIPADVAFVQAGIADSTQTEKLASLGSVYDQPLMLFYRSAKPLPLLSGFKGKRLAVGPEGSGARILVMRLLKENEIEPGGATVFEELQGKDAARALLAGKIDAAFMMGDSAPMEAIRELLHDPAVRLYSFTQADGYTRRFLYLNKMVLPRGAIDFGRNLPPEDVDLVGPTVELVARPGFDPALTELLLGAVKEVHGGGGMFKKPGEFPSPVEREFKLSPAAQRFYRSGNSFFHRFLPFWAASVVDRVLVTFLPLLVLIIPTLRAIPALLRLRINLLLYRWYRILLAVEYEATTARLNAEEKKALVERLDEITAEIQHRKVPVNFATQFYELRGHISFVRSQLASETVRA